MVKFRTTTKSHETGLQKSNDGIKRFEKNRKQDNSSKKKRMLIESGSKWYKYKTNEQIPIKKDGENFQLSLDQIARLKFEASKLLNADIEAYENLKITGTKRDDFEWIKTVLSSGTVNDKLAAYTVLVQDSSAHNLRSIDALIRFINPKGKREAVLAIDTVRDLFIGDLLIPKQKLKSFDELITMVESEFLLNDNYSVTRQHYLVVSLIEDSIKWAYKRFLDQLIVCTHDTLDQLKSKAVRTMFDLFVNNPEQEKFLLSNMINKLGDPTPKIASNTARLLSQVLQRHPSMKTVIVKEIERLLFRPHITNRAQYYCLCFLSEIIFEANNHELANLMINVYLTVFKKCIKLGEVNSKTMSVLLTGVSRAYPYSKLSLNVVHKYLDTFYRLVHYVSLNTAIQTMSLIFNMVDFSQSGSLTDRYYAVLYRFITDIRIDRCSKLSLLLNVVYRSIKKDPIIKRVKAFIQRLLQVSLYSSSRFVIAVMILVSETLKTKKGFQVENSSKPLDKKNSDDQASQLNMSGWVFADLNQQRETDNRNKKTDVICQLDVRNPLYAEQEQFWELLLLKKHFHQTARMFAEQILNQQPIAYDGDPLEDFTLKHFMDRFVFRNPKQIDDLKQTKQLFVRSKRSRPISISASNKEYLNQPEEIIPLDERFIYRYLSEQKSSRNVISNDEDSDIESVDSLEFNDLLDNYEKYVGDEDIDYTKDLNLKRKKNKISSIDDDLDQDDDASMDEEFDFDDLNEEVDLFSENENSAEESDEFDDQSLSKANEDWDDFKVKKPRNAAPFTGKRGFSSITNDIFASAEQFDHLLDQTELESDFEFDEDDDEIDLNDKQTDKRKQKKFSANKSFKHKKNGFRSKQRKRKNLKVTS